MALGYQFMGDRIEKLEKSNCPKGLESKLNERISNLIGLDKEIKQIYDQYKNAPSNTALLNKFIQVIVKAGYPFGDKYSELFIKYFNKPYIIREKGLSLPLIPLAYFHQIELYLGSKFINFQDRAVKFDLANVIICSNSRKLHEILVKTILSADYIIPSSLSFEEQLSLIDVIIDSFTDYCPASQNPLAVRDLEYILVGMSEGGELYNYVKENTPKYMSRLLSKRMELMIYMKQSGDFDSYFRQSQLQSINPKLIPAQ